jgi:hypothetical protein
MNANILGAIRFPIRVHSRDSRVNFIRRDPLLSDFATSYGTEFRDPDGYVLGFVESVAVGS